MKIKKLSPYLRSLISMKCENASNSTRKVTTAHNCYCFSMQFDALVAALPLSEGGEEAQLKRIAELQAENDAVGKELQRQLEAAEKDLKQVQELFSQATDNCLNLKKPD